MSTEVTLHARRVGPAAPPAALLDDAVRLDFQDQAGPGRDPQSLGEHLRAYGPGPLDPVAVLDRLGASGLTGRGGAHVPVAAKWERALLAGGAATVVANGAESEPASAKDLALLTLRPHLVLDGLALAARVLGARGAVLWLHEGSPALAAVAHALRERSTAGLADPPIRVVTAPATYLSGESGAIRRSLAGGPLLPPPARERRRPGSALVQNVETLARVALVARGVPSVADAALVTVLDGALRTVLEVTAGETVVDAVRRARGAAGPPPQAVLVGGYAGTWMPWSSASEHALSGPARSQASGAGLVAVLPDGACGLAETAAVLAYLADSSAGQCGPCLFGLPSVAELTARLAHGRVRRGDVARLVGEAGEVDGRGACSHPDGAGRVLRSALATFAHDVEHHVRHRRCGAGGDGRVLPVPGRA